MILFDSLAFDVALDLLDEAQPRSELIPRAGAPGHTILFDKPMSEPQTLRFTKVVESRQEARDLRNQVRALWRKAVNYEDQLGDIWQVTILAADARYAEQLGGWRVLAAFSVLPAVRDSEGNLV